MKCRHLHKFNADALAQIAIYNAYKFVDIVADDYSVCTFKIDFILSNRLELIFSDEIIIRIIFFRNLSDARGKK